MTNNIKKYLGVDWGSSRIGLALADSETRVATPFKVVNNLDEVLKVCEEEEINKVILGQPIKMSGAKSELSKEFSNFAKLLKSKLAIPVEFIDERLSSKQAEALSGDRKTKAPQDAIAAMLILQSYLDCHDAN